MIITRVKLPNSAPKMQVNACHLVVSVIRRSAAEKEKTESWAQARNPSSDRH